MAPMPQFNYQRSCVINLDTLNKEPLIELNLHTQIVKVHYDLPPKGKHLYWLAYLYIKTISKTNFSGPSKW